MILIFIAALLGFGDCTPGGAVGGYGDYKELLGGLKNGAYGDQQYEQKEDDKKDGYLEENKGYDAGYDNNNGYDDKKDDKWGYDEYVYDKNHYKDFDIREYDYVQKCDYNVKDCKDGRDCYDKASDRSGYDNCKNQYGEEGRYYDIDDRYSGNRYREDDYDDGYDKECYDNYKNSDDYDKCRNRYDNNRNDYEKDCYDQTKNRDDFNKCRRYYRKCGRDYRRGGRYSYSERDWRNDRNCYYDDRNLVGLGRSNREDQLLRPCALDDRQCIRQYLANNSKCKPVYGPIPDPLYLKKSTFYFPFANLTVIRTRLRITGLASIKINEFYVNKDTKNLVIALDFEKLNLTSPRNYFRYKRTGKESIVLADYLSSEHKSGTFTAVIPKIPHLRLDLAEIHADVDDPIPVVILGPKAVDSKDPDVIASAAKLFSNLATATQEGFLFISQLLTAIYIQENLCDFGLKLISIYVNKDTKNLVIALDFEKLNLTSPRNYFRYKRTGKESIVLADYLSSEHKSGTFTAVIPKIPHLRLDLAEIHADVDDPIPVVILGPKAVDSKDPDVIASAAKLFSNLATATQEGFLFISQLLTAIYIQENLCDFGLKLISI